jgi:hypothetical protein
MSKGVSNNIGNKLSNSTPVAIYGNVDCIFGLDLTARGGQAEFIDNLMKDRLKGLAGVAIQCDSSPEPAARKIEHVVD